MINISSHFSRVSRLRRRGTDVATWKKDHRLRVTVRFSLHKTAQIAQLGNPVSFRPNTRTKMLFCYSLATKLRKMVTMTFYQSMHVYLLTSSTLPWGRGLPFWFTVYFKFGRSCTRGLPVRIHWDHTTWLKIDLGRDSV